MSGQGSLEERLRRAVESHQRGDLEGAARLYRAVLAKAPAQFEALHYLGLLEAQRGRTAEGAQLLRRAVGIRPGDEAAQLNLANVLLELGQIEEALAAAERAVRANGRSPAALNSLGVILLELKRAAEALAACERALALAPDYVEALSNKGNALLQLGRAPEALADYERALQIEPQAEQVWSNRGDALQALKRHEEAVASYGRALALRPDYAEALHHRGTAYWEMHKNEAALADIERALAIDPGYAEAHNSRGNVLVKLGRLEEALASYEAALKLWPDYVDALSNRGDALLKLQREEEALASCGRALELEPGNASALNNSGNVWLQRGDARRALGLYERALEVKPDYAVAYSNRGNALLALDRNEAALESYDRALSIDAQHEDALNGRIYALRELGRHVDLAETVSRLIALNPDYPYALGLLLSSKLAACDWADYVANAALMTERVRAGTRASVPLAYIYVCQSTSDQFRCARTYAYAQHPASPDMCWDRPAYNHERIRLAYLSADFQDHPVALLVTPLIELHDRKKFEVIGISFGGRSNTEQRRRLVDAFDEFVDVSEMTDPEVVELLREREIDIAIDLMGHTAHARMGIWARRAAPLQINFLGFPGTSGADYFDYMIADNFVIPKDQRTNYAEKIAYLPDTFMPQEDRRPLAEKTLSRAEHGLPDGGFVYCVFNNHAKISPAIFDVWMRLLSSVGGSVLWLSKGSQQSEDNLRLEAKRRGVAAERLVFANRTERLEDHLARHRLADVFLDTHPYNAHATASNALWMGLPVITWSGNTFAARVAGSLLMAIGMPELVTNSLAEYEALAFKISTDPSFLAECKAKLLRNRSVSPLFDVDRYRRHIETAYATMRERSCAGDAPATFMVKAMNPQHEGC